MRRRNMLYKVMWLALLTMLISIAACTPKKAQVEPEVKEAPKSVDASSTKTEWESRWEEVLKEAKREGRVIVYGPPIADVRQGFIEAFQKRYSSITLEFIGLSGAQVAPKIASERRASLYIVDVQVGGTTTILTSLKQFAVPIKPYLILPEVTDPKAWWDGKLDFSDEAEEINLVFTINVDTRVVYNSDLVDPRDISSFWDLTKPQWRGKIIMRDPRTAGGGLATATFWDLHPQLGMDYIKAFAANKPFLTRDGRLQAEWVARGKYSITVAPDNASVFEFTKAGMPLKWQLMKEGTYSTPSFGSVIVMDKAPHPNAAAVFVNWLLGKEGQTVWTTTSSYVSRRLDAPMEHIDEALRPKAGVSYMAPYKEKIVMAKSEISPALNKIFEGF